MNARQQPETEISEMGSLGFAGGHGGAMRNWNTINVVLRPHHFRCRLCAFSGYSADCDFVRGDQCAGTVARMKD